MKYYIIFAAAIVSVLIGQVRSAASDDDVIRKIPFQSQTTKPLTILLSGKEIGNVNSSVEHTTETLSRVKRQYGYGYGYGNRWYPYPLFPIPIVIGGGFGGRGFGGRGFGGGFGGRGFGGGFGGRGFGGGFGGRGFGGGFGGRGFGGGFGGGRGRG